MLTRPPRSGARWLFWLGVSLAGLLAALVLLAPLLDNDDSPHGWRRVVALFARDPAVRRTGLASAAGLVVSACVFFQPARREPHSRSDVAPRPRWPGVAGA